MSKKIMLYGANGYTSRLIIKELVGQNIKPVLAGRNQEKINSLADKHGFQFCIFSLISGPSWLHNGDNWKINKRNKSVLLSIFITTHIKLDQTIIKTLKEHNEQKINVIWSKWIYIKVNY